MNKFLIIGPIVFTLACTSMSKQNASALLSDTDHCRGIDIISFPMPIYPDKADSPMFTYRAKVSLAGDKTKPIIIFLPGGPGYTSMEGQPKGVPDGYRYIATDQRGTGCNDPEDAELPLDAISSLNMALDVVAMIKALHLDDYVIYGHSFGTVHATKVVAKIEAEYRRARHEKATATADIWLPKSLVLEGTIGKAFLNDSGFDAYSTQWEALKSRLPKNVIDQLSQEPLPFAQLMPSGQAASNWGTYLRGMLNLGKYPAKDGIGDLGFSLLALGQKQSNPAAYNMLAKQVIGSVDQGYFPVFLQVDCAELYDAFHGIPLLKNGKLMTGGPNLCADKTFAAYDSANYPISTPIFYLQGEADPATPVWQAQHHFKSHNAAPRTFVQLQGVGHFALQSGLFSCKSQIWDAIVAGGDELLDTLKRCPGVSDVSRQQVEANAIEMHLQWDWQ